jgi:glutamate-ammonia-ligase adenylyltransferase
MTPSIDVRSVSPWYARTREALERRLPAVAALLDPLTQQPIDAQAIAQCWQTVAALSGLPPDPDDAVDPGPALRRTRQLLLLALIERDVRQQASLAEVCGAISEWARRSLNIALRAIAADLVSVHGLPLDAQGQPQDLLVVGMGKLGGDELNVSSDVDVVFVHRDSGQTRGNAEGRGVIASSEFFHRAARRLCGMLSDQTEDGFVFRVDTRLRPNGDSGPLVVTLPMLEQYFYDQGREWERFAWLKACVVADSGLTGNATRQSDESALREIVEPFVFRRYLDFAAIDAMRNLHGMIRAEATRRDRKHDSRDGGGIDVKLGRGGIREVEFCAQLFQIVRGGRDPHLRDRRTLVTLHTLSQRRLIEPDAAQALATAYHLLRRIEHAVQYQEDAQTHRLIDDPAMHARVARMLGMEHAAFEVALAEARTRVESVFDALLAESPAPASVIDPAREDRLVPDETGAARIEAMRQGRRYKLARPDTRQRIDQLIEQGLREGAELGDGCLASGTGPGTDVPAQADPAWLGRLIDLLDTIAGRPAYLALLVQFPGAYRQLLRMISQARWAADYLTRHPVVLDELLDGQMLLPTDYALWEAELRATIDATPLLSGEPDIERHMDQLREAHHAQLFRLLAQDLAGKLTVERLSDHLSELADRVLSIVLDRAWLQVRNRHCETPRFAVIAYGRLGGKELGYASDLDLVFLYEDEDPQAQVVYSQLAQRLSAWLSTRTAAGLLFEIDLRLRPNGNAGLLVSNLKAFEGYQRESAWVWEHQALTRARFATGDVSLGAQFESMRRSLLALPRSIDSLRADILAMRTRMFEGHPNHSGEFDIKHDAGGIVDIEFMVQFLVLAHAQTHPELLDNAGNIALLERAARAGLIDTTAALACAQAYRDYRRQQHLMRLNDARYARVPADAFAAQRLVVRGLWEQLLGR